MSAWLTFSLTFTGKRTVHFIKPFAMLLEKAFAASLAVPGCSLPYGIDDEAVKKQPVESGGFQEWDPPLTTPQNCL